MAEVKFATIQWIKDSPYGTYVKGDVLDFYVNDSTYALSVKKNNVTITSGDDIPVVFRITVFGILLDQSKFKTEKYYDVLICNSTDKLAFVRASVFPYFTKISLYDHPSCSNTPIVCDLVFDSIPSITNTSGETAIDGSITAVASSTYPIRYNLNADFEYSESTNTTGVFTALGRGNYIVFARDEKNCRAEISVTVGVDYSYETRWQLEYYSAITNLHHKTEILEKSFAGIITEITGSDTPTIYNLRGEGDTDKFKTVITGEVIFNMIATTDGMFVDLFTSDPSKFRIIHSIDFGSGYEQVFTGKVLPNQYQETYKHLSSVSVVAVDGLKELEDIPFLDSDGNQFKGRYKQITILSTILRATGISLNIRCAINLYADGMNTTDADDPLDQAYVNVLRYYIKEENPMMADVLKMILEPYGAQIIQWGGYWNILRVEERVNDFDYRVFDENGTYVSESNYDPVKDMANSSLSNRLTWVNQDQIRSLQPGFGSIRLIYDLGAKNNLLYNGNFSLRHTSGYGLSVVDGIYGSSYQFVHASKTSPDFTGFELVANGNYVSKTWETVKDENVAVVFQSSGRGSYLLSETINLKMSNTDKMRFKYEFAADPSFFFNPLYMKVKVMVTYGSYYLLDDGTWTTTESSIGFFLKKEQFNKFQKLEIVADSPDDSFIDGANLNVKMYIPYINDYDFADTTTLAATPVSSFKEGYRVTVGGSYISYYELKNSTKADDGVNIVRPVDYHSVTNPYQFILVGKVLTASVGSATFKIDNVQIEFLNNGRDLPKESIQVLPIENGNKTVLSRKIYHGSVPDTIYTHQDFTKPVLVETGDYLYDYFVSIGLNVGFYKPGVEIITLASEQMHTAFLSDSSGAGYTKWTRTSPYFYGTIEQIFMQQYQYQYRRAWSKISGSFTGDIFFSPLDTIRETIENNEKYYPIALSIDFRHDMYNTELVELSDIAESAGFTTGFSLGFNA